MTEHETPDPSRGSGTWALPFRGRRIELGRSGTLVVSRTLDQAVLGLTSLLLAWRLGVSSFVPVSALLVLNSFAIVASDLGLGTQILRSKVGWMAPRAVSRVRLIAALTALACLAAGLLASNSLAAVIIGSGIIWAAASEAFIRKSALLRLGRTSRIAIAEISGASLLAVGVVLALAFPTTATWLVAGALVTKHLTELLLATDWTDALSPDGNASWDPWLWFYDVTTFSIANIDYLLIGVLISPEAFAIYSVGYRFAALFVAQLSFVVGKVSMVDFGSAHRTHNLSEAYRSRRRLMAQFGILATLITVASTPALFLLGGQWRDSIGVVLVLACAIPWRMCAGLGMNILVATGGARRATYWEATRLILAIVALSAGAYIGFPSFTLAAAAVAILTAVGYDRVATRVSEITGRRWLTALAPIGIGFAAMLALLLL